MKKILVGLLMAGFATAASAEILVSDDFSYTGALTDNEWIAYSGADASITSDGSVASIGSGAEDIRLAFTDQTANPTYAGFMLNVASLPASGAEYSFGFSDSSTMDSRFGISVIDSTSYSLGIYGTGSAAASTFGTFSTGTDYYITLYMDGVDNHRLWVDSDGTDFASPDLSTTATAAGVDGFFIRQAGAFDNGGADWSVGELVVATTFGETVQAIPEPATMSLLGIGALAMVLRRKIRK
jgi:hypothetical protein